MLAARREQVGWASWPVATSTMEHVCRPTVRQTPQLFQQRPRGTIADIEIFILRRAVPLPPAVAHAHSDAPGGARVNRLTLRFRERPRRVPPTAQSRRARE